MNHLVLTGEASLLAFRAILTEVSHELIDARLNSFPVSLPRFKVFACFARHPPAIILGRLSVRRDGVGMLGALKVGQNISQIEHLPPRKTRLKVQVGGLAATSKRSRVLNRGQWP